MRVALFAPTPDALSDFRAFVEHEAPFPIEAESYGCAQDFCSALFRDPEMIGVPLLAAEPVPAPMIVHEWRLADLKNILFVLVAGGPRKEVDQAIARAHLLMAGADNAQFLGIPREVFHAMLEALSRRDGKFTPPLQQLPNDCFYVFGTQRVTLGREHVYLSVTEANLFELLIRRAGCVVTKENVLDGLYGGLDEPDIKIVDVYICKLRNKLRPFVGEVIKTHWGRGYEFVAEGFCAETVPMTVVTQRGPRGQRRAHA